MSWVNAAIAVGSAVYGAYSSSKASKATIKAGKDPLRSERMGYAKQLGTLQSDPSSFFSNPLYQAAYGEGQQAVTRGLASQGYAGSGNMATGLQKYGQSFGFGMFQDYSKFLSELAGFTQNNNAPAVQAQGAQYGQAGMMQGLGDLGTIFGKYWPQGGTAGTPATTGGGGGGGGIGGGWGSGP